MSSAPAPDAAAAPPPVAAVDASEDTTPAGAGFSALADAAAAPPADVVDKQAAALLEAQEKRGAEGGKLGGVLLEGWAGMPMNERILEHHPNIEVTRASPQTATGRKSVS